MCINLVDSQYLLMYSPTQYIIQHICNILPNKLLLNKYRRHFSLPNNQLLNYQLRFHNQYYMRSLQMNAFQPKYIIQRFIPLQVSVTLHRNGLRNALSHRVCIALTSM